MKVKFNDKWAAREGQEAEVTAAAAKRLADKGFLDDGKAKTEPAETNEQATAETTAKASTTTKKAAAKTTKKAAKKA